MSTIKKVLSWFYVFVSVVIILGGFMMIGLGIWAVVISGFTTDPAVLAPEALAFYLGFITLSSGIRLFTECCMFFGKSRISFDERRITASL